MKIKVKEYVYNTPIWFDIDTINLIHVNEVRKGVILLQMMRDALKKALKANTIVNNYGKNTIRLTCELLDRLTPAITEITTKTREALSIVSEANRNEKATKGQKFFAKIIKNTDLPDKDTVVLNIEKILADFRRIYGNIIYVVGNCEPSNAQKLDESLQQTVANIDKADEATLLRFLEKINKSENDVIELLLKEFGDMLITPVSNGINYYKIKLEQPAVVPAPVLSDVMTGLEKNSLLNKLRPVPQSNVTNLYDNIVVAIAERNRLKLS